MSKQCYPSGKRASLCRRPPNWNSKASVCVSSTFPYYHTLILESTAFDRSASNRVADLEQQLSSVQAQNKWDSSPTQSLRKENAGLRQELLHMRSQCNELQDRLMSRAAIEAELVRAAEQANVSHSDAQPSPVDSISDYNPPNLLNYVTSK